MIFCFFCLFFFVGAILVICLFFCYLYLFFYYFLIYLFFRKFFPVILVCVFRMVLNWKYVLYFVTSINLFTFVCLEIYIYIYIYTQIFNCCLYVVYSLNDCFENFVIVDP